MCGAVDGELVLFGLSPTCSPLVVQTSVFCGSALSSSAVVRWSGAFVFYFPVVTAEFVVVVAGLLSQRKRCSALGCSFVFGLGVRGQSRSLHVWVVVRLLCWGGVGIPVLGPAGACASLSRVVSGGGGLWVEEADVYEVLCDSGEGLVRMWCPLG